MVFLIGERQNINEEQNKGQLGGHRETDLLQMGMGPGVWEQGRKEREREVKRCKMCCDLYQIPTMNVNGVCSKQQQQ